MKCDISNGLPCTESDKLLTEFVSGSMQTL